MYPATGDHQGRGPALLRARSPPVLLPHLAGPPGDPDPLAARHRRPDLLREEPALGRAGLAALGHRPLQRVAGRRQSRDTITYPLVDDLAALTYLANLASLELHVPQWRVDADGRPAARRTGWSSTSTPAARPGCTSAPSWRLAGARAAGRGLGLTSAPVTSGSKGMQLYAALPGDQDADADPRPGPGDRPGARPAQQPDLVVWKMTKSLRPGKVLLDWSQNTAAKTTIAPYSLRGKDAPFVAAPRTWEEVEARRRAPGAAGAPADGRGAAPGQPRRRPVRAGARTAERRGFVPRGPPGSADLA